MGRRERITGESECGCGCYAGQHEIERGEDGIEYGACRAFGGCLEADGEPCTDFHLPEPVVAVVDAQLVDEWNPEEDGPPNDDWIAGAYERQAELREAGLLDEGP